MKLSLSFLLLFIAVPSMAAEWQVDRLRGEVTQMLDGSWQPVRRGDMIDDDRLLRTASNGRAGLSRGAETIELEGDTQIRIVDAGPDMMTTVLQDFGTVSIEAERRNVQHFSVQTPFLAAVVKGTRFTVRSNGSGASVDVDRGEVQVQDTINDLVVNVRPGQEATVTNGAPLLVEGPGAVAVYSFDGVPVANGTATETARASNAGGNGTGNAFGLTDSTGKGKSSSARDNGNGVAASSNASSNGTSNSASSNAGGNGNSASSNAGGNGNGNGASRMADDTETGESNAGGNGKGNAFGLNKD
ncbi:FecR family protein [Devosia beringensis]|uniref:FecR family protein n=1 Tax=Devosia beringensis TaxID=2657486 RepID=UPI00186B9A4C|nr:FecR family protein [Devosia beringensis]